MNSVRSGTRGLVYLVNLNRDLLLSLFSVGVALSAAAVLVHVLQPH